MKRMNNELMSKFRQLGSLLDQSMIEITSQVVKVTAAHARDLSSRASLSSADLKSVLSDRLSPNSGSGSMFFTKQLHSLSTTTSPPQRPAPRLVEDGGEEQDEDKIASGDSAVEGAAAAAGAAAAGRARDDGNR
eukprot:CAMPEP_0170171870 /NCGR_PEP_ID=MMETSP0040_2-20121228/5081_1 /TAXON_ID=641309 /ORGANISM="Lotharella oceanica, Strain CCMP622" /LENGTH=133 /DNA_ID=CAMNT_0010412197 /DNA_START=174 /DNA_END=575 /DNA_ORIENTATION=-